MRLVGRVTPCAPVVADGHQDVRISHHARGGQRTDPPYLVPSGQPGNSPAFQRRVSAGTGTSPAGTAERTSQYSCHVPPFHLANLCRPSGTYIAFTTNPALKCRAIVIMPLRDGQTPVVPNRPYQKGYQKRAMTISNYGAGASSAVPWKIRAPGSQPLCALALNVFNLPCPLAVAPDKTSRHCDITTPP